MNAHTYFESKEKMTELEFTYELLNYLSNAKCEIDYARTYNRGVLDEDTKFEKKLRAVFHELDELYGIAIKSYNKEREKFLKDLAEKEE